MSPPEGDGIRGVTVWREDRGGEQVPWSEEIAAGDGVIWVDLESNADAGPLLPRLARLCPGLTEEMLADLLTPDDQPEGESYDDGRIKLASTFEVQARRLERKRERGTAMRSGVLTFQPVELLAGERWLLTCWHPTRTFAGAEKTENETAPGDCGELRTAIRREWTDLDRAGGGDLGLLIMKRLALSYRAACWRLSAWHEDWELNLYSDEKLDNPEELPNLWGMMAVLRDWLNPLNRPGLRKLPDRAWLPNANHDLVVEIDERIDRTLAQLRELASSMRASFSVLHVQTAEEARSRKEQTQHRVELIAAVFLVPTLVVGFYGANTWVPGQGRHWGFWVMLGALLLLTLVAVATVRRWRRQEERELDRVKRERDQARQELLRSLARPDAQASQAEVRPDRGGG